jgi:hypothetical protein
MRRSTIRCGDALATGRRLDKSGCTTDCIRMAQTTKKAAGSTRKNPPGTRAYVGAAPSALSHGSRRSGTATTEIPAPAAVAASSEVWQARIGAELAAQLRADAEVLGLTGRTEIVKAALELLHRQAAEQRMATSVDDFYGDAEPPLPLGVSDGGDGES